MLSCDHADRRAARVPRRDDGDQGDRLCDACAAQWEQGNAVRKMLAERGVKSVAAEGFGAPGVVVSFTGRSGGAGGEEVRGSGPADRSGRTFDGRTKGRTIRASGWGSSVSTSSRTCQPASPGWKRRSTRCSESHFRSVRASREPKSRKARRCTFSTALSTSSIAARTERWLMKPKSSRLQPSARLPVDDLPNRS